ncbi:MAG: hypothetical protein IJ375_06470 [Oscillospiraceae bacterium]|nr:hypothetical protein [Oscillospiraceae bacterium]
MKEHEQDFDSLDLEDILKEFGGGEELPEEELSEEALPDLTELPEEEPEQTEAPPEEQAEEPLAAEEAPEAPEETSEEPEEKRGVTGDTIRLEDIARAAAQAAEKRKEEKAAREAEAVEEPVAGEELPPEEEPAPEEPLQEPEMEYIPPEPIPFRPRSRLRELKRKLIAGPEKRYYELSEMGVGKLQLAILVCLLVIAVSAGAGALYAFDMIPENRTRLMVFGQILAMLIGALMGYNQIMDGIGGLFRGKFSLNTMLFVTFIACFIDGVFCLKELRVPICAAFTLEVTMALWSTYQRRSTEMGQMDTMRKATRLDSVLKVEDYYEGRPGILRGEGQVEDFMDHYDEPTVPEKQQGRYALVCLLVSIIIAVAAGVLHGVSMGFQILSTTLLVAVPASFFIAATRPMAILERRLHSLGTVLCGWSGVKAVKGRSVYPLSDQDIFPTGSIKMNGVKFFGDRDPEVTISYATSLICANGGGLVPVFQQLLESRNGPKYPVKNFQVYPGGGIGGEICGEPVVMGSLKFLQDMGVEIPAGTMVNQAAYVSIRGEFCGLFAINYARMKYSASGVATICAYKGLTPLITADDFMLTPAFLKEKFGVSTRQLVYPTREEKAVLSGVQIPEDAPVLALTTHEGLAPAAYAVTGARALRTACRLGLTIHIVGGCLGMLIMAALAVIGAVELLTPLNILLYQLIWMIPGLLVTEWTRAI